jgi:ABC-type branched-subunit amino acid transport system ATPase component
MSMTAPLLQIDKLTKVYKRGRLFPKETFRLEADLRFDRSQIVGVMGPNGSGKTTLFELITGSNQPSSGSVRCMGQDIHRVRYRERDRLAIHYHQSYQVRHFAKTVPELLLERSVSDYPMVHLFDEPQFNRQDVYIGFMLDFFRALRAQGRLVFLCVHPQEPYHIEILREICEQFVFVRKGAVSTAPSYEALLEDKNVRDYLGALANHQTSQVA